MNRALTLKCAKHFLFRTTGVFQKAGCASHSAVRKTVADGESDLPIENLPNPYLGEKRQCILCKYKIQVDYKNVRLLSQFVSPFTGLLYDKHITGLCEEQQKAVKAEVKKARYIGLMPYTYRLVKYCKDPRLFNPQRPQRPHKY